MVFFRHGIQIKLPKTKERIFSKNPYNKLNKNLILNVYDFILDIPYFHDVPLNVSALEFLSYYRHDSFYN